MRSPAKQTTNLRPMLSSCATASKYSGNNLSKVSLARLKDRFVKPVDLRKVLIEVFDRFNPQVGEFLKCAHVLADIAPGVCAARRRETLEVRLVDVERCVGLAIDSEEDLVIEAAEEIMRLLRIELLDEL